MYSPRLRLPNLAIESLSKVLTMCLCYVYRYHDPIIGLALLLDVIAWPYH